MDLNYSPEELEFRDEVRQFLRDELPSSLASKVRNGIHLHKEDLEGWHAILNRKGWLAGTWPREFGGTGWSPVQRHIFEEETCLAHAPRIVPFGLAMLGPVLQKFGSKAQQERFLPRILNGEDWWCQATRNPARAPTLPR